MYRRPLNPRKCNIALDANALDLNGSHRDALVARFRKLMQDHELTIVIAGGVRGEVQHPNTPDHVQASILPRIFNLRAGLNELQMKERMKVAALLQGNAKPGRHKADASHLSEAAETGCGYFITHDQRILDKRPQLAGVLPPSLTIATLEEFFSILDQQI
jgi:predicted nucleic acid-binding protein